MSFFSDLYHGNLDNLGNDLSHAGSSFANHPQEWAEVAGGAAALATGGLALGALGGLEGAGAAGLGELGGAGGLFGGADLAGGAGGILTGGDALGISAGDFAAASAAGEAGLEGAGGGAGALGFAAESPITDPALSVGQMFSNDFGSPFASGDPLSTFGGGATVDASPVATESVFAPSTVSEAGDVVPAGTFSTQGAGLDPGVTAYADSLAPGGAGNALSPAGASIDQTVLGSASSTAPQAGAAGPLDLSAPAGGQPLDAVAGTGGKGAADGAGLWGTAKSALNVAAPVAGLGYLGYEMLKGPQPLPPQAGQLGANNAALTNLANTNLNLAANGQLTTGQAATIAQKQAQLTSQWKQVLMNQGVTNPERDSRWPQIQAQIDQQMNVETQTMIQQTLQAGLAASGQSSQNLLALANMQVQQDTNYTNSVGNAARALGGIVGAGNLLNKAA